MASMPSVMLVSVALIALSETPVRAELQFPQPQLDLGEVKSGAPLTKHFNFTNSGPEAIEVVEIRASCGCLVPRLAQRVYPAGASGIIDMEVHTLGQAAGPQAWTAQVAYRRGDSVAELTLRMTATIVREVGVEPAALTVFAEKAVGHEIRVTDARPQPLSIRAVRPSAAWLTSHLESSGRDERGRAAWTIQVEISASCPEGRHEQHLMIHTDDPEYRELKVPVTVVKRSPQALTVLPNLVSLTAAAGQPVPSRIVLVKDGSGREVIVDRVEADHPAITCHHAKGPGAMSTVKVQVDRRRVEGAVLNATIKIHATQPLPQTLTVPVTCQLH